MVLASLHHQIPYPFKKSDDRFTLRVYTQSANIYTVRYLLINKCAYLFISAFDFVDVYEYISLDVN